MATRPDLEWEPKSPGSHPSAPSIHARHRDPGLSADLGSSKTRWLAVPPLSWKTLNHSRARSISLQSTQMSPSGGP